MEAVELEQIGTSIRSAMGETAGQFRQAAARSNEEIGKVVKDISRMFKAQREELNEIGNTLQESIHQSESESAKMDRLAGIFEESVQIQNDMLTELKRTSAGMKYLGDSIIRLNDNIMSSGPNGLLGSLTGLNTSVGKIGDGVVTALRGAGLIAGGAALGAAVSGADRLLGGNVSPMASTGSSSEAMGFFQSKGWTKEQAAGIVGNLQVESGNFSSEVISGAKKGDSGTAVGIAQWHPDRQANFRKVMGKELIGSSFQEQLAFVDWELKNTEAKAGKILQSAQSAADAAAKVDEYYERSSGEHRAKRIANAESLAGQKSTSTNSVIGGAVDAVKQTTTDFMKSEGRGTTTPIADQPSQAEKVPSADAPRTERIGEEHGHGPISGTAAHGIDVSKVKLIEQYGPGRPERPDDSILNIAKKAAAETGMESITATSGKGNYISPAGRAKGQKTTMHSTGLAVDVAGFSDDKQKLEFIKNAKAAGAKGVGVYDNGSVHIDLGRERSWNWGMKDDAGFKAALGAGSAASPQGDAVANVVPEKSNIGPSMPASVDQTTASSQSQATPVAQEPVVSGPSMGGMNPMAMMGMMGGMMPGGMGGIVGMVAPMLMSALGSLQAPESAAATLETAPSTNVPAEMIQALSKSADNTKMLTQAAINKQVQQESAQDPITEMLSSVFGQQQNTPDIQGTPSMAGSYDGYNGPSDIGWPDWAEMIGGNHWKEMKNYKKNMWG